jgi:hypothetical protein
MKKTKKVIMSYQKGREYTLETNNAGYKKTCG